jgi:NTE family protein
MADGHVALVLSGGGARGAYEAGALSVLVPELERRGERPTIVVGTSVGAFNAAFAGSRAHRPTGEALEEGVQAWLDLHWRDVLAPLVSPRGLARSLRYLGRLLWVKRPRIDALLYPDALPATLDRIVSFDQLQRNVEDGTLAAAAVTTTSALSSRTVVFHSGGPRPERDRVRGIDYVDTPLAREHVLASGAIPAAFPAVHVPAPERARGWYFDGGTRLNTPIKPALELGADRVVVIGLNSVQRGPDDLAGDDRPDVFEGAAQVLQALLTDRLEQDVRELAEENLPGHEGRTIPYIFVTPRERLGVGRVASKIWRERYAGLRGFLRSPDISTLGRFTAAGNGPVHGELLSFFLFAPEFAQALVEMGRDDARHWLSQEHSDGPWRLGPPPD